MGRLLTRSAIAVASGTVMPRSASIRGTAAPVAKTAASARNNSPSSGHDAGYGAGMGSNGAPPCVSDEPPAAALEVLDQKLNEAWQVDPSLARIPDGTSIRDGGRVDTRRVNADVLGLSKWLS